MPGEVGAVANPVDDVAHLVVDGVDVLPHLLGHHVQDALPRQLLLLLLCWKRSWIKVEKSKLGVGVAIGVGVTLGAALVLFCIFVEIKRRRRQRQHRINLRSNLIFKYLLF